MADHDFTRLLASDAFTFLVGADKHVFRIHTSVFDGISEPLSYMMNNGKMQESIDKSVELPDVQPTAFSLLAKFAYQGIPGLGNIATPVTNVAQSATDELVTATFGICDYCLTEQDGGHYCYDGNGGMDWRADSKKASKKKLKQVTSSAKAAGSPSASASFCNRQYGLQNLSHEELDTRLRQNVVKEKDTMSSVDIAKLYVLADKYMVKDLPEICLHLLHQELCSMVVDGDSVNDIVELIYYTYSNTPADQDSGTGTGVSDKLRDLVISFAAEKAQELVQYPVFTQMLRAGGDQVADFTCLTLGQKTALQVALDRWH